MKNLVLSCLLVLSATHISVAHGSTDPRGVDMESGANAESSGAEEHQYVIGQIQITSEPVDQLVAADGSDFQVVLAKNESHTKSDKSDETDKIARNCKSYPGIASVYGTNHGSGDSSTQKLATGGRLNVGAYTAAMKPPVRLGATATVINKRNGRTIKVRINDRGPYVKGRVIDLTPAAARGLGFSGLASVEVLVCN